MTQQKSLLFLSDNDGTALDTFRPGPTGYGVNEAYSQALLDIFGETAVTIFQKSGLKNRAPGQVIDLIFYNGIARYEKLAIIKNAKSFFNTDERYQLNELVPEGKGFKLDWNPSRLRSLFTELLVRVKLSYLMKNIGMQNPDGTIWPAMFPGVREFLEALKNYGDFGIISSGHELFIKKAFEVHNMECPEIMVTDDDVRSISLEPKSLVCKPSPYLIHLALRQWRYGDSPPSEVVYTGDDLEKDGQMAANAGVPFIHYDQSNENHWYELKEMLLEGKYPF